MLGSIPIGKMGNLSESRTPTAEDRVNKGPGTPGARHTLPEVISTWSDQRPTHPTNSESLHHGLLGLRLTSVGRARARSLRGRGKLT